jgi:hypothetical protein
MQTISTHILTKMAFVKKALIHITFIETFLRFTSQKATKIDSHHSSISQSQSGVRDGDNRLGVNLRMVQNGYGI